MIYPWYQRLDWWVSDLWRKTKLRAEHALWTINGGYTCMDCATATRFKRPMYEGDIYGTRMMLEYTNHNMPFGYSLCPHCLFDRISTYWTKAPRLTEFDFNANSRAITVQRCDFTGATIGTIDGIRAWDNQLAKDLGLDSVIIGGRWWNGHHASLQAIEILLKETGQAHTSMIRFANGATEYIDGMVSGPAQPVTEITQGWKGYK